jgi:hypothetical protein
MPRSSVQYAVTPGQMWLRLKTNHCVLKEKEFLASKLQCLKSMKLDTIGTSDKATAKQLEAPCELSVLTVTANEAHMVGEAHVPAYILIGAEKYKNI